MKNLDINLTTEEITYLFNLIEQNVSDQIWWGSGNREDFCKLRENLLNKITAADNLLELNKNSNSE